MKVIVVADGVAVVDVNPKHKFLLVSDVMVAVTVAPVLKRNPDGALKTTVPLDGTSPDAPSVIVGPVSVVYEPPVVSALIEEPPVAAVTVTVANAVYGQLERRKLEISMKRTVSTLPRANTFLTCLKNLLTKPIIAKSRLITGLCKCMLCASLQSIQCLQTPHALLQAKLLSASAGSK